MSANVWLLFYYFNDGHVLHLRPETVAIRRQKNVLVDYDAQMVSGDKSGLNFLTFLLQLRETPEKHQPGNWSDRDSNPEPLDESTTLPLDHSGSLCQEMYFLTASKT